MTFVFDLATAATVLAAFVVDGFACRWAYRWARTHWRRGSNGTAVGLVTSYLRDERSASDAA